MQPFPRESLVNSNFEKTSDLLCYAELPEMGLIPSVPELRENNNSTNYSLNLLLITIIIIIIVVVVPTSDGGEQLIHLS